MVAQKKTIDRFSVCSLGGINLNEGMQLAT